MTKVIRKSQLRGIAASASDRKGDTAKLVEAACVALPPGKRPSSQNVWVQGAGAFGLSAVSSPKRHLGIVRRHQRAWDVAHGRDPGPDLDTDTDPGTTADPAHTGVPAPQGPAPQAETTPNRVAALEARVAALSQQLAAALDVIDGQDARLRQCAKEKAQHEIDLARARAEPRKRLPRVYGSSGGTPASQ